MRVKFDCSTYKSQHQSDPGIPQHGNTSSDSSRSWCFSKTSCRALWLRASSVSLSSAWQVRNCDLSFTHSALALFASSAIVSRSRSMRCTRSRSLCVSFSVVLRSASSFVRSSSILRLSTGLTQHEGSAVQCRVEHSPGRREIRHAEHMPTVCAASLPRQHRYHRKYTTNSHAHDALCRH